jgi:hypothetical protein
VPDSTTAGGNKRGTHATDWQKSRTAATQVASGNYSGILSGQNNTASGSSATVIGGSSNTASGLSAAVVGGSSNTAGGTFSGVFSGSSNSSSGSQSGVFSGSSNTASAQRSAAIGGSGNIANAAQSIVFSGNAGNARSIIGNFVYSASDAPISSAPGVQQTATLLLGRQTTDATATRLASDNGAAGTTNQVILPNNSAYYVKGSVIATVTGGGNTKSWDFIATIKRGANAAATSIVGAVILNTIAQDAGAATWVVAVTADTTNGGLAVTVTGQAATTIRWVCKLESTEVTY